MLKEINIIKEQLEFYFLNAPETAEYKINHIIIGDTEGIYADYVPCCIIIPQPSQRIPQYIGQDNDKEELLIRFYVSAGHGDLSIMDISTGLTKLIAMCEMFKYIIRKDPTFNAQLVTCEINSVNYYKTPSGNTATTRMAEIQIMCMSRTLWNPNNT